MLGRTLSRALQGLALLAGAIAGTAQAASTLSFGNLAPRATADSGVSIDVDGRRVVNALAYAEFAPAQAIGAGAPLLVATAADGTVLASNRVTIPDHVAGTLLLVGNGTGAPFAVVLVLDHNHPIFGGYHSLQTRIVAPPAGAGAESAIEFADSCELPGFPAPVFESRGYLDGGDDLDMTSSASCFTFGRLGAPTASRSTTLLADPVPGGRYWFYVIGDGVAQPLRGLLRVESIERTVGVVAPSASMDGLWFDPNDPGIGYAITFNPAAGAGAQVQSILFGFDQSGAPSWSTISGGPAATPEPFAVRYYEFFGLPTQTGRQTLRVERGAGQLVFHSCTEATLFGGVGQPPPRDATRLVKLLPLGGCTNPQFG